MSKNKHSAQIIPENEYVPELEAKVKEHTSRILASNPFRVNKKYTHIEYPAFKDSREQEEWEIEEIRRCVHGYDGLPGKFYYYFNHCKIESKTGGFIRPEMRAIDLAWFKAIEECKETREGIVCIKRRQVGASWKEAADALHDCSFNNGFHVGMNSKSLEDSEMMFENIKLIHQELPGFLKPVATAANRRDRMIFAEKTKDSFGNPIFKGTRSSIRCVAPTITAHAGKRYGKLIIDEAGEQCWGYGTEIRMHDGSVRFVQDISVGDVVMGMNSEPLTVVATTSGESDLYKITPNKGKPFVCNGNHLLTLKFNGRDEILNISAKDFIKIDPSKQKYYQLFRVGVEYPKQEYFFDPYWLGLWLGDGFKGAAKIVTMDHEIKDYLIRESPTYHDCDYHTSYQNKDTGLVDINLKSRSKFRIRVTEVDGREELFTNINQLCDYYNISVSAYTKFINGEPTKKGYKSGYDEIVKYVNRIENIEISPCNELRKLGILNSKRIPSCYLKTSREDRLKLLAGIIDSDGYKDKRKDRYEVTLAAYDLAKDIQELCLSLGFYASFKTKNVNYNYKNGERRVHYRIGITGNTLHEIPCRLPRKKVIKIAEKTRGRKDPQKTGFKIENVGRGMYYGFKLDNSPYFLLGDYTVGHNCDLLAMWAKSEPCITQDTLRVGVPIIFGTVGDITSNGKGLRHMWFNHKSYDFKQFAFWGYNALIVDEYGNDQIEDAVRWIIYQREKIKGRSLRERNEFNQMFPINEMDAFMNVSTSGVGDQMLISEQLTRLYQNPVEKRTGRMRRNSDGGVDFVPDPNGKIVVYDLPKSLVNGYVAAADPADHDDVEKSRDSSNLALAIVSKPFGVEPPKLVLEYVDRPKKLDEWFEQSAMCLQWYNNTKVLPEDNRARMLKYFLDHDYEHLLALTPKSVNAVKGGVERKYGIKMTEDRRQQMMGLIEDYIDNYHTFIPSVRVLEEFKVFGGDHADDDLAVAFGWALIMLQADKTIARNAGDQLNKLPKTLIKKVNGVLQYVNQGKPLNNNKPKYPTNTLLFKR